MKDLLSNRLICHIAIELSNARMPAHSGDLPMRKTQHAALKKKFIETIQRYQDIERTYQQKYRQRVERQIKIVQPNATSDDIDRVLESDEPPQIFAQSVSFHFINLNISILIYYY